MLPKYTKVYIYGINLKKSKQLPYRPIYSLRLVQLKTLKTYLKINLANNFINLFKFLLVL